MTSPVHSRHRRRRLVDVPAAGQAVRLRLRVRRAHPARRKPNPAHLDGPPKRCRVSPICPTSGSVTAHRWRHECAGRLDRRLNRRSAHVAARPRQPDSKRWRRHARFGHIGSRRRSSSLCRRLRTVQGRSPAGGRRSESFGAMNDTSRTEGSPPLTQTRQFWVLLGYAAALGVVGALASLVFMGVIGFGDNWSVVANPGSSAGGGGDRGHHRGRCRGRLLRRGLGCQNTPSA